MINKANIVPIDDTAVLFEHFSNAIENAVKNECVKKREAARRRALKIHLMVVVAIAVLILQIYQ